MTLKAIPTTYAGCHFRSKLEARWAFNLDRWGIAWTYEPEGYELPSGDWYLPDFWLPDINTWLEVKGPGVPGRAKFEEFARVQCGEGAPDIPAGMSMTCADMAFVIGGVPKRRDELDDPAWTQACRYCGDWVRTGHQSFLAGCQTSTCAGRAQFATEHHHGCGMDSRCFVCGDKVSPLAVTPFAQLAARRTARRSS